MATGYTYAVKDGKITNLREFAMRCARNFGALVTMRDEPADAPIPEEFEPSSNYAEFLKRDEERLAMLQSMTKAEIEAAAAAAFAERSARHAEAVRVQIEEEARYRAMLAKVRSWTPPTSEHEGLRSFMEEQLMSSIEFDSYVMDPPKRLAPGDWHDLELQEASRMMAISKRGAAEEVERAKSRTKWVKELRASLAEFEETP